LLLPLLLSIHRFCPAIRQQCACSLPAVTHSPASPTLSLFTPAFPCPCSCPNCDEIHGEDIEELVHAQTDWQDETSLGLALHGLVGLRELVVDLRGEGSEVGAALGWAGWAGLGGRAGGRAGWLAGWARQARPGQLAFLAEDSCLPQLS
jgi:hypothetical protein